MYNYNDLCFILCFTRSGEPSCVSEFVFQMSSSDEEAASPVLGASSSKDPPPPPPIALASESEDDDRPVSKKARQYRRPRAEWDRVLEFAKGDDAEMDEDEMKAQIDKLARELMEAGKIFKLAGHKTGPNDYFMWKLVRSWTIDGGHTLVSWFRCPLSYRFGCTCEIKKYDGESYMALEKRGEHDDDSHHPDKDKSKHLKLKQMEAIHTGVRVAPNQSARQLRRHLVNLSPSKRVDPKLLRNMKNLVHKFRAELTLEQLDKIKIDDSFGSLVRFAEAKWFTTLFAMHVDPASDFHLDMFDVFVIGKDINAMDDIVYINFSTLWHLCNILRNIMAGWVFQLNGDVSYKHCRRTVALLCLGVSSLGNVNNPICWAIIPEAESAEVMTGTWKAVQDAAIMLMRNFKPCGKPCPTCEMVQDLLGSELVQEFMKRETFADGEFEVDGTLSDRSLGWSLFTHNTFHFDANMCRNHTSAIPAANHAQQKYFRSQEVYDDYYDEMVKLGRVGHEVVVNKAHHAMPIWIEHVLKDAKGAKYWQNTWSLSSGHGRFSVVHGMYGGSTTNGSKEANWRDKGEICPPSAPLGTFMGALTHNIQCKGNEHKARLEKAGHPNHFPSIPVITKKHWETLMERHPKTLLCSLCVQGKHAAGMDISDAFDEITQTIYDMADDGTALHHKICLYHEKYTVAILYPDLNEERLSKIIMPSQRLLYELDPTNSRSSLDVRHEVWDLMRDYLRLISPKNKEYEKMSLPDILNLNLKFNLLEYKYDGWSVIDWGCTCVACLRDCVCPHSLLLGLFFSIIKVPDDLEIAIPTDRRGASLRRGIAGSKRKNYLAAKALEKKKVFVKSKKLKIVGPMVSASHLHFATDYSSTA